MELQKASPAPRAGKPGAALTCPPSLPTPRTPVWCLLGTQTSRQPCRHPAAGQMGSGFCRFNTLPAWELPAWSHSRHSLDQGQDRSAPSTGQNITIPVLGAGMVIRDMPHPAIVAPGQPWARLSSLGISIPICKRASSYQDLLNDERPHPLPGSQAGPQPRSSHDTTQGPRAPAECAFPSAGGTGQKERGDNCQTARATRSKFKN